ncbi:MAG: hypothetical protein AAGA09_09565 [Pseudomonadota bacterium]
MANRRSRTLGKRMEALLEPPENAKIDVGFRLRRRLLKSFEHRAKHGRLLNRWFSYSTYAFGFLFCAPALTALIASTLLDLDSASNANDLIMQWKELLFIYAISAGLLYTFWGAARLASRKTNDALDERVFSPTLAPNWASAAEAVIKKCAEKDVHERVLDFQKDLNLNYVILKRYLPVPIFELRRPENCLKKDLSPTEEKKREEKLFLIDCLSAGVLSILGAKPHTRFGGDEATGDEPVVHDLYWRWDVQEIPDADQSDIFLRFHQSVIDRDYRNTCRYKTFAALNNYRQTPILLLRVKDVIDCLTNANNDYSEEEHKSVFAQLDQVTSAAYALKLLSDSEYNLYPPRLERIPEGPYSARPGPILKPGENGDWIMQFDPARVWVVQEGDEKRVQAIAALRNAIHLASRRKTVKIVLDKRDLLVVDNRRALIARQEDRPSQAFRHRMAAKFESLEGRWLRKIYGFAKDTSDGRENFIPKKNPTVNDIVVGDAPPPPATTASLPPASLYGETSSELAFDYGENQGAWPDYVRKLFSHPIDHASRNRCSACGR